MDLFELAPNVAAHDYAVFFELVENVKSGFPAREGFGEDLGDELGGLEGHVFHVEADFGGVEEVDEESDVIERVELEVEEVGIELEALLKAPLEEEL